jgi:hypothetical protein
MKALRLYAVTSMDAATLGQNESFAPDTSIISFRSIAAVVSPAAYSVMKLADGDIARHAEVVDAIFSHHQTHNSHPVLPAPPGTIFKSRDVLSRWLELHYFTLVEALGHLEGNVAVRVTSRTNASDCLRSFRGKTVATAMNPIEGSDKGTSASFLVTEETFKLFNETVQAESQRRPELGLELTGPWPPYDFVRMQFKA